MTQAIDSLKELHQLHQQLEEAKTYLDRGPLQIRTREKLVQKRKQEQADFQEALKKMRMEADAKSLELKSVEKKLEDLRAKLNSANSNREFDIFKEQIKADEMAKSVLEDEILESYDKTEQETGRQQEYEERVKRAEHQLVEFTRNFETESETLQQKISQLEAEIRELERPLPTEAGEKYRRLLANRGARAMAAAVNGACGNCYLNLTPQQRIQLKTGPIQFCSNCGSMLYLDEAQTLS